MNTSNARPRRGRVARTAVALVIAFTAMAIGAPRAHAIGTTEAVLAAVQAAYGAYGDYQNDQNLQAATRKIIRAIEDAKQDIITEVDNVAASEAMACAEGVINQFANFARFTRSAAQVFANDAVACLGRIRNLIRDLSVAEAVDKLGYAFNAMGPIVLTAYTRLGFDDGTVISVIRNGNTWLRTRLAPPVGSGSPFGRCWPFYLHGDSEPGAPVEVHLNCRAYNGDTGKTFTWSNRPFDYNAAQTLATRRTSRPVAVAVLGLL